MDEAGLIKDAQQGDLDAFNRLILAYQDRVHNQAFRVLGESQSADDATQEAFLSAYKNLRSFRGGSFRAWLLRIVTNACYDELRRRKRRPTTPLEPVDDEGKIQATVMAMDDKTASEYAQKILSLYDRYRVNLIDDLMR